jgi:hypothetical protein
LSNSCLLDLLTDSNTIDCGHDGGLRGRLEKAVGEGDVPFAAIGVGRRTCAGEGVAGEEGRVCLAGMGEGGGGGAGGGRFF